MNGLKLKKFWKWWSPERQNPPKNVKWWCSRTDLFGNLWKWYAPELAPIPQNGDPWKTTERPKIVKVFQQSPRSVKFAVSVEWLRKPLKDHWKTKNNFSSKIPVGPWRQLKVYWETNKTIERSLKDHLAYCQRSLKDQSRSLKDWPRPLKDLWKTDQDPRENSDRKKERLSKDHGKTNKDLWKFIERSLKDCWKTTERPFSWKTAERLFWTVSKSFGDHGEHEDHWKISQESWKTSEIIESSLKDHWKIKQVSWSFSGLSAVLPSVEWGHVNALLKSDVTRRDHVSVVMDAGLTHSQFHSKFHSRRHSLRITLKYTRLVRMRSSYAWTMKPWQRSEWRLGFNSTAYYPAVTPSRKAIPQEPRRGIFAKLSRTWLPRVAVTGSKWHPPPPPPLRGPHACFHNLGKGDILGRIVSERFPEKARERGCFCNCQW